MNKKLPTIKVGSADYSKVATRVKAFREENPKASSETISMIQPNGEYIFRTTLIADQSDEFSKRATGQSYGKVTGNKAFEKLETISLGRALANLGYLAGGEIASSEEMEDFLQYKKDQIEEAKEILADCKTLDELKKEFMGLGSLMSEKEIINLKDELKTKLK